ncbi:MAG TPA: metallophosphoesterase family protein, partial [Polyangiaceae bacterium]
MRSRFLVLGPLVMGLVPMVAVSCQGKSSSAPPSTGDDGGEAGVESLTYTPQGCQYSYTPPSSLAYQDLALDDTGPVDPTNGVPQRVRVGLGGGTTMGQPGYADLTTTAAFTWETAESDHAAKVKIGTSASALAQTQTGYTWTLQPSLGNTLAYFHEVHVCGLTPNTTYFYQVGGGPTGSEVWSATQSFTTLPTTGTITVGVFGDARDSDTTWKAVHQRMKAAGVLLSLVDGDVVDIGAEESLYAQWLGDIAQSGTPYFTLGQQYILPINGNHENDVPTSFANWAMPGDGDYAETYASFTVGSVHFTMIDDQAIGEGPTSAEAQAQLKWVDQDLAAANGDRANHPFIVAMNHRGLFSTSLHSTDSDVVAARNALAP